MKRRTWDSKQKTRIVLEGLSGQIEITKLCAKYEVSQTQYYKWRDQFLKFSHQAFETKNISKKEQKLQNEVGKLKKIIGDLTVELKKSEDEWL
jgi:transposase-like protein